MGKKLGLLFVLVLLMFSLVSSTPTVAKINQAYNIIIPCENYTCSSLNVTIFFPNSSSFVVNGTMTNNFGYASYSVTPPVFGDYQYILFDGSNTTIDSFKATSNGLDLDTQSSLIYLIFFILLISFFWVTIFGISKLPSENARDEEGKILKVSYLKYLRSVLWFFEWILVLGVMFLASNLGFAYLGETLFATIFFRIFFVMLVVTPLVVILQVLSLIAKIIEDKTITNLMRRGGGFDYKI